MTTIGHEWRQAELARPVRPLKPEARLPPAPPPQRQIWDVIAPRRYNDEVAAYKRRVEVHHRTTQTIRNTYQKNLAAYREQMREVERRIHAMPEWFPLKIQTPRLDVVGGDRFAWFGLLSNILKSERYHSVDIADLGANGFPLGHRLADRQGTRIQRIDLPTQFGQYDAVAGTSNPAGILANLVEDKQLDREFDADLAVLDAVAECIGGDDWTTRKTLAILAFLSKEDAANNPYLGHLSNDQAIRAQQVAISRLLDSDAARNAARMYQIIRRLISPNPAVPRSLLSESPLPWASAGIASVAIDVDLHRTELNRLRSILASALIDRMGQVEFSRSSKRLVVIVGCERMEGAHFDRISALASNSQGGIQLVTIFEHYGETVDEMFGRGNSADAAFFRMSSADESTRAAKRVGTGMQFVFCGASLSAGDSTSRSETQSSSESVSESVGYSWRDDASSTTTRNQSRTSGKTLSHGQTTGENRSASTSFERREEFVVRPETFQDLPDDRFILRPTSGGQEATTLGDVRPGRLGVDRIAK